MLFLATILYFIFLVIAVSLSSAFYFWWILFFIGVLSFAVVRIIGRTKALVLLPILLMASSFILSPFFVSKIWFFAFAVLSVATFSFMLFLRQEIKNQNNQEDRRSHPRLRENFAFNKSIALIVMAVCFFGLFAIQENTGISFWAVLIGFFAVSTSIFWEILRFNFKNSAEAIFMPLVIGFIVMEFAWALSLWPIGFFSNAIVLFALSYAFLDIVENVLTEKISFAKVVIDVGIALAAILIVAGTSRWMPL